MRYGTEPKLDQFEGELEGKTFTVDLYNELAEQVKIEGYYVEAIRSKRTAVPKRREMPKINPTLTPAEEPEERQMDAPIRLVADDDPSLRGLDTIFILEENDEKNTG